MSVFKDFPGLEIWKKFKDFQGPARALISNQADLSSPNLEHSEGM